MNDFALTANQRKRLAFLLDQIIPPSEDGTKPGAGELGMGEPIEQALRDNPELAAVVVDGLDALGDLLQRAGVASDSPELDRERRSQIVAELVQRAPALVPSLTFHTYTAYYQNPRVLEALGLEARPPHPGGYEMRPFDESLLEPVRARPRFFRQT